MARPKAHEWRTELDDLMRGIAGAFLFGAPFLYTMEVWWKGNFTSPPRMMLILCIAYLSLVLLNIKGGFRAQQPRSYAQILAESAEGLAIALFAAALSLTLIGILRFEIGVDAILGKVITLCLPFAIGVGIANNILLKTNGDDADSTSKRDGSEGSIVDHHWHKRAWRSTLSDAGAALLGAIIVGASIAPTDEIPMIASSLSPVRLLLIMASSLLLSYIIVFAANFGGQRRRRSQPGFFQGPISETLASYLISLAISLLMLWLFQVIRIGDPVNQWISYMIVLGLPSTIGGAAGRLAM
ncbi:TIGR02587 family membrane protein [Nodosilinea sp. LEGE 07298]|uniref:TIGR02587 family membrane protein n=1 Tax=Nodosilinea sp. LEGE 07298 TaxID=2777970 RepID=UPI0018806D1F|nr:TIGR02587 family membrane protein [Nodosilinea sp. LEGE 07298]MBE9110447.1 TIGR02587 family membrane protein [Nodosilinea sp. LEGE 07298]